MVKPIREFRKFADQPLTRRGSDCAEAVQELNKVLFLTSSFVNKVTITVQLRENFDTLPNTPPAMKH
jgi:hypothetical protein